MPANSGKEVALLCRRYIDWQNINLFCKNEESHFGKTHPIDQLRQRWETANPNVALEEYRYKLHNLATKTWKNSGVDIFYNPVELTQENIGCLNKEIVGQLREYNWIIPIDDDDWVSPKIYNYLQGISQGKNIPCIAYWNTASVHFGIGKAIIYEKIGPFIPSDQPIIYSCGYAISNKLASHLDDLELEKILMCHGPASEVATVRSSAHINTLLAVHLRHLATAGSASNKNLYRKIGKISEPKILNKDMSGLNFWLDPPTDFTWAYTYWIQLQEIHANITASLTKEN